ncbi:YlxQ family RNA-binding protein [Jeotgalibacillus sp. R-1-5s-1]|uniref:YlxQ family RNA-binding protein n=1 Tax=Jeotgalibacillus sp. R-1-5s-1 TaxID=2555897 RepID=UPI0010695D4F|nr:YlxQ family RNA-binding protein [Jeotgalibacillus sp. R-1-5s-1]TFE03459.1 YlxQ family RNA-binding protein [Jeotgalibacillus sp. R-1-5s-1]
MSQSKWMSLLGLATRAGKVISGEELVVKEIRSNKAKLVLLSEDASLNTTKKVTDKAAYYRVPVRKVADRYLLGQLIGKDARVTVAVLDKGFAEKLITLLDES